MSMSDYTCWTHRNGKPKGERCTNCNRISREKRIATKLVSTLLAKGHQVSVHDGEGFAIKLSDNKAAILAAMNTTDNDVLYVYEVRDLEEGETAKDRRLGTITLIYGNDCDLISDYSWPENKRDLEPVMARLVQPAQLFADTIAP